MIRDCIHLTVRAEESLLTWGARDAFQGPLSTTAGVGLPLRARLIADLGAVREERDRPHRVALRLGPEHARVRTLFGVPAERSPAEVADIVRSDPEAFFLKRERSLVVSAPVCADGTWRVAAVDADALDDCIAGCAEAGFTFGGVAPDVEDHEQFVIDPTALVQTERARRIRRRALIVASLACMAAVVSGPALIYQLALREATIELAAVRASVSVLESTFGPAAAAASRRQRAVALASRSLAMSVVLGDLASALPDSAAITHLRLDTTAVHLTVLAPPHNDVVRSISGVESLHDVRVAGPLTRETAGGAEVQRTSLTARAVESRTTLGRRSPAYAVVGKRAGRPDR